MLLPTNNRRFKPLQISYTRLGERRGALRFWQEGLRLASAQFYPGESISLKSIPELSTMIVELGEGEHTVSGRKNRYKEEKTPIIDINNKLLEETFGVARLLRTSYYNRKLVIQAHSHELNRLIAIDDFKANLRAGVLSVGTVCVGGAICSQAIKKGAETQDVRLESEWVIDIENKYLQSMLDNTDVASSNTTIVEGALGDVEVEQLVPVNVLNLSLPCTGYSVSGRSKNRLENPESHKTAGTTILKTMEIVEKLMPPVITNENVVPFASSASADLMSGRLRELGYHVETRVLGGEMGTLEDRKRSILVASHPSLSLSLDTLMPLMRKEDSIRDILEDIPLNDPSWKTYDYLAKKEIRDKEQGKGFRRQLLSGEEESCGVIGRGYAKARSTEPFVRHATNPELSRLFTEKEHAAVMKIPVELVANMSKTQAHEILGQSGSYALFTALGAWLSKESRSKLESMDQHTDVLSTPELPTTKRPIDEIERIPNQPIESERNQIQMVGM